MTAPTNTTGRVLIAGVPWPVYKLVALAVGMLVFVVVGLATLTVASAVVAGSAMAAVTWLGLGLFHSADRR